MSGPRTAESPAETETSRWKRWLAQLRRWGGQLCRRGAPDHRPEGAEGIAALGHRAYVGGRWEELGRLQFEFLKSQGLLPEHLLVDVACGSLRAGIHLIPYLQPEHYWGVDKESGLIEAGLTQELSAEIRAARRPGFTISQTFNMPDLERPADVIWMHSLWTHLPPESIHLCLQQCLTIAGPETRVWATFFETRQPRTNPTTPHDHATFFYTVAEIMDLTERSGWSCRYHGNWGHPRGQKMLELRRAGCALAQP